MPGPRIQRHYRQQQKQRCYQPQPALVSE
jgi:hypothetical protein